MDKRDWYQIIQALGLLTQIGLIMLVSIGIGFFAGLLLDNFLGREVIFKLIGVIIGVFSGFYSNFKLINKMTNDRE